MKNPTTKRIRDYIKSYEAKIKAWEAAGIAATETARKELHEAGIPYVIGREDKLLEVYPDGTEKEIGRQA